ncbi:MAG TPA: type II toxin-antitoxin system PemK/MazF family toxin [Nocardioidaceae bacterium]|nr:type II toxin-antitoxin system PemK/MazF family toxin [Nocardioidaceae bacterium]
MVSETPRRGEVWLVALGAARAGEAGKTRPALIVSVDALNTGAPEELVVVVPLSSSLAPSALRIDIEPIAGLDRDSRAICRAVRSVAASRLRRRLDRIGEADMARVEEALSLILGLEGGG